MTTIKQIAAMAGVSRGTVDRVLNNRGGVNKDTERIIRELADKWEYVPNKLGKTLSIKQKNLKFGVALLNSKSDNQFINELAKGVRQKSGEFKDYGVTVEIAETFMGYPQEQLDCIDNFVQSGVQGLVIMAEQHPLIREKLLALKKLGVEVVTVNTDVDDVGRLAYVGGSNIEAGKTAAGLMSLITGGCANIGVMTGSMEVLCHAERIEGFEKQAKRHYPNLKFCEIVEHYDDDFSSYEQTKNLLKRRPDIDALYLVAAGVYGSCRAVQDLNLVEKIKIICFDFNDNIHEMVKDRVISAVVAQQPLKQGAKALSILFDFVAMDTPPVQEFVYTENVIKIFDNL